MSTKRTAADRQRAADIRAWAAARNLKVAQSGRIPEAVVLAYDQAQADGPGPPDDPGPDWAAAARALGVPVDGLDLDNPPPDWPMHEDGRPGAVFIQPPNGYPDGYLADDDLADGQPPAPGGPPPPASLQDAKDLLAPPGQVLPPWAGDRGRRSDQRPPPPPGRPKLTAAQRADIGGNYALLMSLPATALALIDPACGGALADNIDTIISKSLPLVLQSGAAVKFLSEAGEWIIWFGLGQALLPVAGMFWSHHVTHTITVVDGRPVPAVRDPEGRIVPAPEVQQSAPDWSAYGTEVPGHVPPVRAA